MDNSLERKCLKLQQNLPSDSVRLCFVTRSMSILERNSIHGHSFLSKLSALNRYYRN